MAYTACVRPKLKWFCPNGDKTSHIDGKLKSPGDDIPDVSHKDGESNGESNQLDYVPNSHMKK